MSELNKKMMSTPDLNEERLETLKCLLSAYRERIKCIYIDPPYNVDFVYNVRLIRG